MPIHIVPAGSNQGPSRREFLRGLALAGTSLTLGRSARAASEKPAGWLALVSDTHVAAEPSTQTRGQVMADNLRAVVAEIVAESDRPAGVVIDGDLALKDGQAGDYRTLLTLLEPIRKAAIPIHLTLGNHDDRRQIRAVLGAMVPGETEVVEKQVSVIETLGLRLILLDSLDKVNGTPGLLGDRQRDWLGERLDARPDVPAVIFVHHNLAEKQPTALVDTEKLLDVLKPRKQAKAVVFGHTHVWDNRVVDGLNWLNLPAVGYPFSPLQPIGWCRFRPAADGAEVELRAIGGNRQRHGQRISLPWRTS